MTSLWVWSHSPGRVSKLRSLLQVEPTHIVPPLIWIIILEGVIHSTSQFLVDGNSHVDLLLFRHSRRFTHIHSTESLIKLLNILRDSITEVLIGTLAPVMECLHRSIERERRVNFREAYEEPALLPDHALTPSATVRPAGASCSILFVKSATKSSSL
jgi:hypothetical protein